MVKFGEVKNELTNILNDVQYSSLFLLADENTSRYCYPLVKQFLPAHTVITIKAGEANKTLSTCEHVWAELLAHNADRSSLLINIGGGVVTDLGGFAAGCYKRGIQFINIPTSLLAMVDASVGAKTGVDFKGLKNAIGLFNQPLAVIIDQQFLKTLPQRHFKNGKAEIIKHGLIADNHHLHEFLSMDDSDDYRPIIQKSVAIKQQIVNEDYLEQGVRKILNFGHTIGHAVESYSVAHENDYLLHGEAIAIGMIAEIYLSQQYTNLSENDAYNSIQSIKNHFTIRHYSLQEIQEMIGYLKNDKKNTNGQLQFSLLQSIGNCVFNISVSDEDIVSAMKKTMVL